MDTFFEQLVARLAQELGISPPAVEDGTVTLSLDSYVLLILRLDKPRQVLLSASIAQIAPGKSSEVCRAIAGGQYFFHQTQGATLAVDPDERFVVLQRIDSADAIDAECYVSIVEHFLRVADHWRVRIDAIGGSAAAESNSTAGTADTLQNMVQFMRV